MTNDALSKAIGYQTIDYPIYVVTTKHNKKINGQIAVNVLSITFIDKYPRVLVFLAKDKYTHELVSKSKAFALNLVAENQLSLVRTFGFFSGRKFNKFSGVDYKEAKTGSPVIKGCVAYADCKVVDSFDFGEYTIFVGMPVASGTLGGSKPLRISEFLKRMPKSWQVEMTAMEQASINAQINLVEDYVKRKG